MKLSTSLTGFFLCLFISSAWSQNRDSIAIRRYYEENSIVWLGRTKYEKNGQLYPLHNLKTEFIPYRDASTEFRNYQKTNRTVIGAMVLSSALLFTSIVAKDRTLKYVCLAGSFVSITVAVPLSYKGLRQLSRSIWYYNRDILLK